MIGCCNNLSIIACNIEPLGRKNPGIQMAIIRSCAAHMIRNWDMLIKSASVGKTFTVAFSAARIRAIFAAAQNSVTAAATAGGSGVAIPSLSVVSVSVSVLVSVRASRHSNQSSPHSWSPQTTWPHPSHSVNSRAGLSLEHCSHCVCSSLFEDYATTQFKHMNRKNIFAMDIIILV